MSTVHTVTLPDGKTAKRTSAGRVYSHVVVGRRLFSYDLAAADQDHATDAGNYAYFLALADGTSRFLNRGSWEKDDAKYAERVAEDRAKGARQVEGIADAKAYVAAQRAQRVADVKDRAARGYYDAWGALTWASRRDLAEKQLGRWPGYETRVLPVTETRQPKPRGAR